MSTIVYRISILLGAILADGPVGMNLGPQPTLKPSAANCLEYFANQWVVTW
jgi:hypothetical protein